MNITRLVDFVTNGIAKICTVRPPLLLTISMVYGLTSTLFHRALIRTDIFFLSSTWRDIDTIHIALFIEVSRCIDCDV